MPDDAENNNLGDKRYVTLVVRLLVNKEGIVDHGSLVDLNEDLVGRFRRLEEITDVIYHWLHTQIRPNLPDA